MRNLLIILALIAAAAGAWIWWRQGPARPAAPPGPAARQPAPPTRAAAPRKKHLPPVERAPRRTSATPHRAGPPSYDLSSAPEQAGDSQPPWQTALAAPPRPHAAFRYENLAEDRAQLLSASELRQWLDPVADMPGEIAETGTRRGDAAMFDGWMRLRAPWPQDAVLRMSLDNHDGLGIHLYHEQSGVTLVYNANRRHRWTALLTRREDGQPQPSALWTAANDQQRGWRSAQPPAGPVELHWRDGQLRLVRGDLTLLAAPLAGPPTAVFFQGRAAVYGLELTRSADSPPLPPRIALQPLPLKPAELDWNVGGLGEGAELRTAPDGAVELIADNTQQHGWAFAALPVDRVREVVVEVEGAAPGAAVYLGPAGGQPRQMFRFVRNTENGALCLARHSVDDICQQNLGTLLHGGPLRASAQRQWIRLLAGCGAYHWWVGQDGQNWAGGDAPDGDLDAQGVTIGLFHVGQTAGVRLRIRSIQLAPLASVNALASSELPEAWRQTPPAELPSEPPAALQLSSRQWRRLRLVRMLSQGGPRQLQRQLRVVLADIDDLPVEQGLSLLTEASRLMRLEGDAAEQVWLVQQMAALGRRAWNERQRRPFSLVRSHLLHVGAATSEPFPAEDDQHIRQLIRLELIGLLESRRWEEALELTRQLQFFQQQRRCPLTEWAQATARRRLGGRGEASRATPADWLHPLIERLDKDTFNAVADLHSLLQAEAYEDVGRLIVAKPPGAGLAPSPDDDRHLLSLADAVQIAAAVRPQLQRVLRRDLNEIAELRVRQAMQRDDPQSLETQARLFPYTPAAAEAHQWLGDRALAGGDWRRAAHQYRLASAADLDLGRRRAAQLSLARAMQGNPGVWSDEAPASLGGQQLEPAEFNALLQSLAARHSAAAQPSPGPAPRPLTSEVVARLDGPTGRDPQVEVATHVNRLGIDWCGRQIAAALTPERLLVANRFQLAAYDRRQGSRLWQTEAPSQGLQPLRSRQWPLTAMRPLLHDQRLLVRQLYGHGPVLRCFGADDGRLVWQHLPPKDQFWASDPVLVGDRVAAIYATTEQSFGECQLELRVLRGADGQLLHSQPLVSLRESWLGRRHCQIAALADGGLLAALGGAVLRTDMGGRVRWIRTQLVLPVEEDLRGPASFVQPPVVLDSGRADAQWAVVQQPGVPHVECLDVETGRLIWQRIEPDVRRLAGRRGDWLLVETDDGLQCWNATDGAVLWRQTLPRRLVAQGVNDEHIMCCVLRPAEQDQWLPVFQWRRWNDGELTVEAPLAGLVDADPRLGPLVADGSQWWSFYGRGPHDATRDVVQIREQGATP